MEFKKNTLDDEESFPNNPRSPELNYVFVKDTSF